uniref:Metaxin glutathione S-transferase domain-containing protein n=1 Tax=Acrobeloides nanus TaxID=290746 RepID=A0A914DXU1_9BILA
MIESSFFNGANWFKMKCNEAEFAGAILELQFGKSYDFLKRILAPYFKFQFTERYVIEGTGKHSDEEVLNILRSDLRAIETYLGDKDFFFGENSSLIDIVIFSHVAAIYYVRYNHLAKDLIDSEFPTILNHTQKVAKKFFSEFKFGKE